MAERREKESNQQTLGLFSKSYVKRYEQWKKRDLLHRALITMPRQVRREDVIDNLLRLNKDFSDRLKDEG